MEELVDLVRADVGQDAATLGRIEEPGGAQVAVEPVRAEAHGLDDAADRARPDQLRRPGHRPHLEALGEVDRPDPPGLLLHPPDLGERSALSTAGLSTMTSLP